MLLLTNIQDIRLVLFSSSFWMLAVLILAFYWILKSWSIRKRLPPGPIPLPLIGNYFGTKLGTHEITLKLKEKYGDILTIFIHNIPCVILTKYEQAESVFKQATFNSRMENGVSEIMLDGSPDVSFAPYGSLWQLHRKIMVKCLREIVDIASLEHKVLDAVDQTVSDMLSSPDKVDPQLHMNHVVYNILAQFAYGKSYEIDDPEFLRVQKLNDDNNDDFGAIMALGSLPFAKHVLPLLKRWPLRCVPWIKRMIQVASDLYGTQTAQIVEVRNTYVPGQTRNFCDAVIREQKALKKGGLEQITQLTDGHVSAILFNFFVAGTDTTSRTLAWFCLFMVMHPEIQEECYRAIKETIGDRAPELSDKPNLAIVEASVLETLRLRPPTSMGLPHANTHDAEIGTYFIPKGSGIIANLYAMHIDPEYWTNPLDFDPKLHFMDDEYKIKAVASFAPFGFGRRICPGEQMSRNNAFMIATRLLQKARLEPLEGVKYTTDYDVEQDFVFTPLPFFVKVAKRE